MGFWRQGPLDAKNVRTMSIWLYRSELLSQLELLSARTSPDARPKLTTVGISGHDQSTQAHPPTLTATGKPSSSGRRRLPLWVHCSRRGGRGAAWRGGAPAPTARAAAPAGRAWRRLPPRAPHRRGGTRENAPPPPQRPRRRGRGPALLGQHRRGRRGAVRPGGVGGAADAAGPLSIFTGKFPPEHGVRDNGGFFLGPESHARRGPQERGYRTGAFVGAYVLDSKWGIDQGFDTYFDDFDLSEVASDVARRRSSARPTRSSTRRCRGSRPSRVSRSSPGFTSTTRTRPSAARAVRVALQGHPYNGEIAFTDSQVGRARSTAASRSASTTARSSWSWGITARAWGITARSAHGFFIYNSVTHVPFVIRAPFSRDAARASPIRCGRWT